MFVNINYVLPQLVIRKPKYLELEFDTLSNTKENVSFGIILNRLTSVGINVVISLKSNSRNKIQKQSTIQQNGRGM